MNSDRIPPSTKPYGVWVSGGEIRSGHATLEQAEAACSQANRRAIELGLTVRYETHEGGFQP